MSFNVNDITYDENDSRFDRSKRYTTEPDPGSITISPPGIKRHRASYGQFWYGKSIGFPGFLYKKNNGVAGRRSTTMAPGGNSNCNTYQNVNNAYTPGSGVGGSSIAVRRAKRRYATINTNNYA